MRWVHISDIHFGYENATVETMREKLIETAQSIDQVDCLFVTGDLRYGKNAPHDYPRETVEFLIKLRDALRLQAKDVYIVPGNHDVDIDDPLPILVDGLLQKYTTLDGKLNANTLRAIDDHREEFKKLYKVVCGRDEKGWHYCEQRKDFNIICLNTAMLCGGNSADGTLVVGSCMLNDLAKTVDRTKPSIVLAHHDFDALRQEEQQKLELTLKDMGATLYLCGHKHVVLNHEQNTYQKDKQLHVFLCGTNMDQSPDASLTDMDFFVGETDDGQSGWVQAYKWYPRQGRWGINPEFSMPQNAQDSKIYFPKEARPVDTSSLRQDVIDKYHNYIRTQCGEIELAGMPINDQDVSRRFELHRIFIPLRFKKYIPELGMSIDYSGDADPIPAQGIFRKFILSVPGGGKSTLLKWMASVYSFPDMYRDIETHLPQRELFPVWIRCRDIQEGSSPSIWKIIQDIAIRGEWLPHGTDASDFTALVLHYLSVDKLLLLIDGLDEIGTDRDREVFVDQLRVFSDEYPNVSIIVSSRPTGLSWVTQQRFPDYDYIRISDLENEDINNLCLRWNQVVRSDSEEVRQEANALAERITENSRILRLARNPMLLTTLLLVERRVGRLPTKRVELYEEAVRVLLETWNARGYRHHPIDLDEARYQLAYVAYHMMTRPAMAPSQLTRITRTELRNQLMKAREELAEYVSGSESINEFIRNIEYRSALLVKVGYDQNEFGEREEVYEFQHLTFQEYLTSYAITHSCYPGADIDYDPISALSPHLTNHNMLEVIPLVAVRLPRGYPSKLVDVMMDKMTSPSDGRFLLRTALLQLIADEVSIPNEKVGKVLERCFITYYDYFDKDVLKQIMAGKHADRLVEHFRWMDDTINPGFDYHVCVLDVLSKRIPDPIQFYLDNCDSSNDRLRANAISVLTCPIAFRITSEYPAPNVEIIEKHEDILFDALQDESGVVQHAALWGLQDCSLIYSAQDWERYYEGFVRFANNSRYLASTVESIFLPDELSVNNNARLTAQGFANIVEYIRSEPNKLEWFYGRLVTLTVIGILASADEQRLDELLEALRIAKNKCLCPGECDNNQHGEWDEGFHRLLNRMVLNKDYPEDKKKAIRIHMLLQDLAWVMIQEEPFHRKYIDYSLDNEVVFDSPSDADGSAEELLSYCDNRREIIIEHIYSRLDSLGISKTVNTQLSVP